MTLWMWGAIFILANLNLTLGAKSCDYRPVPACTCWNPRRPMIGCIDAGLTQIPDLPVDYINSLDLSHNNLQVSEGEKLGHNGLILTKLKLTHLLSSGTINIPTGFFSHVKDSIRWLDMSHNPKQIKKISEEIKTLKNLEHLDLSHNGIYKIDGDFANLKALTTLYLAGNPIEILDVHAFLPTSNLNTLSLTLNSFSMSTEFARNLSGLKKLHVTDSVEILMESQIFFKRLKQLEELRIENSQTFLKGVLYKEGAAIKNTLKVLSLPGNNITVVPNFGHRNFPNLEVLDLSNNSLNEFSMNKCMPKLRSVDLRQNKLVTLWQLKSVYKTTCFPKFESADLRYNNISFLSETRCLKWNQTGMKVLLSSVQCKTCKWLKWIVRIKKRNYRDYNSCIHPQNDGLFCFGPDPVKGKSIFDVAKNCNEQ